MDGALAPLLVSIPGACQALGDIGRTTLYDKINSGDLVKVNIGRRGFITAASLRAYVERLSNADDAERTADDSHGVGVA